MPPSIFIIRLIFPLAGEYHCDIGVSLLRQKQRSHSFNHQWLMRDSSRIIPTDYNTFLLI